MVRLLERDGERADLERLVAGAIAGEGSAAVIAGPAGIGKTALLEFARGTGEAGGLLVLTASGGELERDVVYGVARQLFSRFLRRLPPPDREALLTQGAARAAPALGLSADGSADTAAVREGLYWLVANLAERGPVLLTVDDVQWADAESEAWLWYLARRVGDLPVGLVLGVRTGEPGSSRPTESWLANGQGVVARPAPLSQEAVDELVRSAYGSDGERAFCEACHAVTAGNPFLLGRLLAALRGDGVQAVEQERDRVRALAPEDLTRSILLRLGRMGPAAMRVADAVAVLGDDAAPRHVAALAGTTVDEAAVLIDELAAADILRAGRPVAFAHPIVRSAVYSQLAPGARSVAHRRAAELLHGEDAGAAALAAHLVHVDGAGSAWASTALQDAARDALASGAPRTALQYLRRAQAEPPPAADRAAVARQLGIAALHAADPGAVDALRAALALATDPEQRAELALAVWSAATHGDRYEEGMDVLAAELDHADRLDPERALELEARFVHLSIHAGHGMQEAERILRLSALPGDTPAERVALDSVCYAGFANAHVTAVLGDIAARALRDGPVTAGHPLQAACAALIVAEQPEEADRMFGLLQDHFRVLGRETEYATALATRARAVQQLGSLPDAEAMARDAFEIAERLGRRSTPWLIAFGRLVSTKAFAGRSAEAAELLALHGPFDDQPEGVARLALRIAEAETLIEGGDHAAGAEAMLAVGEVCEQFGIRNPAWCAWRSEAARALVVCGERDRALVLAREELELAQITGLPGVIGRANHALGLATPGEEGTALLARAAEQLAGSPLRLREAMALCEYGAALRRANQRADAREPLRRALDLAQRCGADALAERALTELRATGARPRRLVLSGIEALTASERRVAEMATSGLTNRQMAQALFVTKKTVERHLGSIYLKLDVHSREELAVKLGVDT